MQFPYYIEDWLLLIARVVDKNGNNISQYPFSKVENAVNIALARYDIGFVQKTTALFQKNVGLTEKQIPLAVKIITKYRKQFEKYNLDPSYLHDKTPLRIETRQLDRTRSIVEDLDSNEFQIRFPYDPHGVQFLHETKNLEPCGQIKWNRDQKVWQLARTEGNLRNMVRFLDNQSTLNPRTFNEWYIEPTVKSLLNQTEMAMQLQDVHVPTLDVQNNTLVVHNSNQWIDCALEKDNFKTSTTDILTWTVRAVRYGLHISDNLKNYIIKNHMNIASTVIEEEFNESHSKIVLSNLEQLIANVNIKTWIFLNFYPFDTAFNEKIEDLTDVDTVGEKIFFVKAVCFDVKAGGRDLKDFENEIKSIVHGDFIVVSDAPPNTAISSQIERLNTRALKVIYIQPDLAESLKDTTD